MQQQQQRVGLLVALALALAVQSVSAVITVQIGGATRLSSSSRQREKYSCFWDCDLVGCQIARDDDECAYDCEKICRVRYNDYNSAAGRSGVVGAAAPSTGEPAKQAESLSGKSGPIEGAAGAENDISSELIGAGTSVRLHLPRNATARNFAIWERCQPDASTGKLTEKPFNL